MLSKSTFSSFVFLIDCKQVFGIESQDKQLIWLKSCCSVTGGSLDSPVGKLVRVGFSVILSASRGGLTAQLWRKLDSSPSLVCSGLHHNPSLLPVLLSNGHGGGLPRRNDEKTARRSFQRGGNPLNLFYSFFEQCERRSSKHVLHLRSQWSHGGVR